MKFNFEDYKRFCYILRLKPSNYTSLQDYRRYFDYLENRVDIDYVIERLEYINKTILYQAYVNEIKFYIECEKEYDSVKNNENGILDYLNSITDEEIGKIADAMLSDDYLCEQMNITIGDYLYNYRKV